MNLTRFLIAKLPWVEGASTADGREGSDSAWILPELEVLLAPQAACEAHGKVIACYCSSFAVRGL